MRDERGAAQERAPGAPSVARPLAAVLERSREGAPEPVAAGLLVARSRGGLERRDRLFGGRAAERQIEEASGPFDLLVRRGHLRCARQRGGPIAGALAARDLPLVEVDDVGRLVGEGREA